MDIRGRAISTHMLPSSQVRRSAKCRSTNRWNIGAFWQHQREEASNAAPPDQPPGQRQSEAVSLPPVRDDDRIFRPVGAALAVEAHHRDDRAGLCRIERDEREPIDAIEVGEVARPLRRQFPYEAKETQVASRSPGR